ncbi:hypothetical protein HFMG06CAA_2795 [Mycoplasmoides gallisepticum CA06_2006.052-5-2P]|uniref:Uncharacterized protein n=2 Tax=Mycoplasmoides gallisepticum TaxID=2096 RepID=J3VH21_MYCGL|nr:hypothetical protein HFMG94VAA_2743 [Mycoplasmoides gallisepticum VA94_7994-1-7P]AFP76703.1 hypothetical protein HFMG95NCA_2670 [Mycoplasmoides gallisepticum NC95_13295-2-2P]AFP77457.1 hypothetical protein HFMG96NCA_2840 [Mycoplasmoides gallisepticum NC96_1596-4-2P]AFP78228.1 hypothetical protein HFMG01NYA_2684 [Mycoplasmoides gallisepticum NY01_2001.047-5-1P]AFP78988.1 hypothetical protein HFMG01WIA_2618 [Mycoplasmoides gallisepticum WI01_2001.043-13-2P]AFP79734.1 hypothetical protein HFMG
MNKIKFRVVSFNTKLRWLLIGKLPLERKARPKILEYIFFILNNIITLICSIVISYWLIKLYLDNNKELLIGTFIKSLQTSFLLKLLFTIIIINRLINFVLCIHTYYILTKTEFNKIYPIIGTITAILLISPLTIILFLIAYQKNELAFE